MGAHLRLPDGGGGSVAAFLIGAILGAPICLLLPHLLRALRLERTNFAGRPIFTGAGAGFLLAALPLFWLAPEQRPALAALCLFGALGFLDDRWGTPEHKGLRGHFGALRRGKITTGLVKALGGSMCALLLGAWLKGDWRAVPAALLIALTANLFNLLDLRPLRALKAFWLLGAPLAAGGASTLAVCGGFSLLYGRAEARRAWMLGDTGSNALGAALGTTAAFTLPDSAQIAIILLLGALHAWAEKNSITAWIAAHGWVRRLDDWGWRSKDHP